MIARWNDVICSTNRKCYLFRAHIAAQFFVSYGLNIDQIEAILDNDSYKQGKKVSRIQIEIYSPQIKKQRYTTYNQYNIGIFIQNYISLFFIIWKIQNR